MAIISVELALPFLSFWTVVFQMLWLVYRFLVTSSPAVSAMFFINVSIEWIPWGILETHTGAFVQSLSFHSGVRYSGPLSWSPGGRFCNSFSKWAIGHWDPPIRKSFCVTARGFLFSPPCLVFVGPSIHSTWTTFPAGSRICLRSSFCIWWCSCRPRVPKCCPKRKNIV